MGLTSHEGNKGAVFRWGDHCSPEVWFRRKPAPNKRTDDAQGPPAEGKADVISVQSRLSNLYLSSGSNWHTCHAQSDKGRKEADHDPAIGHN